MSFLKKNCFNIIILILGVILALTPHFIAPVCPVGKDGFKMSCYYGGMLAMYSGVAIAVMSLVSIFIGKKFVNIILSFITILCGLSVHFIPHRIIKIGVGVNKIGKPKFIGYCMKSTMNCVKHNTFTIVSILGILIAVLSLGYVVYLFMKKEN